MTKRYPCVYFESDWKCNKFGDEESLSFCVMGPCEHQTLSNADHIREMDDEELAAYLCAQGWLMDERKKCFEWLKQPYEGGEDDGKTD
jgi:hypothetical protein